MILESAALSSPLENGNPKEVSETELLPLEYLNLSPVNLMIPLISELMTGMKLND